MSTYCAHSSINSYFYLDHYCYAAGYYHILTGRFFSIQVDALGNVYAGGANPRTDFPMVNAIDTQLTGTCGATLNSQGVPVSWYHPRILWRWEKLY
jgi:hypothetical protein